MSDLMSGGGAMSSGDPALEQMALDAEPSGESTEPDNTNLAFTGSQMSSSNQSFVVYREYVWGLGDSSSRGGVDECLLYTDELDAEWWCLTDLTGDLVGVCDVYDPDPGNGTDTDMIARVCAQWTYDAYGGVMSADHLHAFSPAKIGHKGLFVERLDVSSPTAAQLVPFAHTVYHNRNRAYVPMLGRFLQLDPNQSASALIAASPFHGRGAGAIAVAFSLDGLFGDGANLYQYLGSNPWMRSDPTGLFIMPDPGDFITGALSSLVQEYAGRQLWNVEWATSWEAGDDWHTRSDNSWIIVAIARGLYDAFEIGFGEYTVNPLDYMGGHVMGNAGRVSPGPGSTRAWLKRRVRGFDDFFRRLDRPSVSEIADGIAQAKRKISNHNLPRTRGRNGSPSWDNGLHRNNPNSVGMRVDPPHGKTGKGLEADHWHINYWNNPKGVEGIIVLKRAQY